MIVTMAAVRSDQWFIVGSTVYFLDILLKRDVSGLEKWGNSRLCAYPSNIYLKMRDFLGNFTLGKPALGLNP